MDGLLKKETCGWLCAKTVNLRTFKPNFPKVNEQGAKIVGGHGTSNSSSGTIRK